MAQSRRDNFSSATRRILAERVGYCCSNPDCRRKTVGPNSDPKKSASIGEAAHIRGAAPGGPRYDPSMTAKERASSENGIWLCKNCARLIDVDTEEYTIDLLEQWKRQAEASAKVDISTRDGKKPKENAGRQYSSAANPFDYYRPIVTNNYTQSRFMSDASDSFSDITKGVFRDQVSGALIISPEVFQQPHVNKALFIQLVSEKLRLCRKYAASLELDALKDELSILLSHDTDGIEGNDELHYYMLLCCVRDKQDPSEHLEKCGESYYTEAKWLIDFYNDSEGLTTEEFRKLTAISQVFAIDKMFTEQQWDSIIQLHEEVRDESSDEIRSTLDLYYGLSLMNTQNDNKASQILHDLFEKTRQPKVQLYATFADIKREIEPYERGECGDSESLNNLINQLQNFHELKQYKEQELLVAALTMESLFYLGFSNSTLFEKAIDEYSKYSDKTKDNITVKYYYTLCLELNGDLDTAINVYEGLPWKTESIIAERYMIALLHHHDFEEVARVYHILSDTTRTIRTEAVYLLALDKDGDDAYMDKIRESIENHRDRLEELYIIASYVENEEAIQFILPILKTLITPEEMQNLSFAQKNELLFLLTHFHEIELIELVLSSIGDARKLDTAVIDGVYRSLFEVAIKEYNRQSDSLENPDAIDATDRIADFFLKTDIAKKLFLQIKMICAGARRTQISYLHYSKELFSIAPKTEIARNIVSVLISRQETDPNQYTPYLEEIEKSENPDHCMISAVASRLLGHEDRADFFAYKALYLLNGKDDFDTFSSYFRHFSSYLYCGLPDLSPKTVHGNVVLILEEANPSGEPDRLELCLDSEAEFNHQGNRSLDVEHLSPTDSEFIKLQGAGLKQELYFRGRKYRVAKIIPRNNYCFDYIMRKIIQNPDKFNGITVITNKGPKDLLQQIKEFSNKRDDLTALLKKYHFENNEIGLPIDMFTFGDYSKYIPAFKYLLNCKDGALYAGEPVYADETEQKYIPTLSTMILLGILNRFDVLRPFLTYIFIPESYLPFIRREYSNALSNAKTTSCLLGFEGDKPVTYPLDDSIPEIWEAVLSFCNDCQTNSVSDQERIEYKIQSVISGEKLVSDFRISAIHLDALVLAQKEHATLLCDDLFFRKIATGAGIRNLNIVSLLLHLNNQDARSSIMMELSKTNYLFLPLFAPNDKDAEDYFQNILTGEKKALFYGERIRWQRDNLERLFHEWYRNDNSTECP